jgi:hypothetical protein
MPPSVPAGPDTPPPNSLTLCGVRGRGDDAPMSEELARRTCQACGPGTPPITEDRAVELEAQLDPSWARDGTLRLRRELEFRNFRDAFGRR